MDLDPDPDANNIISQLLILVLLTFINAFFSCAEMATVSANKNKIKRLADGGNKKAILVQKLMNEPTMFLSTIQVAITLAGFFSSAFAATGISKPLGDFLLYYNIPYGDRISFVAITIFLSYFTLVFGELIPKRIAMQKAESISMFTVKPILFISKIASPFIKLLSISTNIVMKFFGYKKDVKDIISREEIKSMIEEGQVHGVLNENEIDMINSIIEFDDTLAKEIMTPRVNVFAINILDPIESYSEKILESKYSRIPVYEDDIDNIIGIIYYKDFMREALKYGINNIDIRSIMFKPYLVPDSKNIFVLFKELKHSKNHIAILIDEYGGFSGIVTLEDIIEEVMGDIEDEYDVSEAKIKKLDNNTYLLDGLLSIDELNNELDLDISSENYETISGFLIDAIGEIPNEGDHRIIEINQLTFKIESIKQKRIEKVKLYIGTSK